MGDRLTVTLPDPWAEPLRLTAISCDDGYMYEVDGAMTPADMLALGTALLRRDVLAMEEREVSAQEHAEACRAASDLRIVEEDPHD